MPDIVRYVTPVAPRAATGVVQAVYRQSKSEIGRLVEPVTMFSPSPVLLAANWAAFREPLLATGVAPRMAKEAVAAAVSQANECPFCVDAHTIMLYGGGSGDFATALLSGPEAAATAGEFADLARWAQDTTTADGVPATPPFGVDAAPEFVGVLVYFHFLNRVINVLLTGTFLPERERARRIARKVAGRVMARTIRAGRTPGEAAGGPGPDAAAALPADLAWAAGSPTIAGAFAGLSASLDAEVEGALSPAARELVTAHLAGWRGENPGLSAAWTEPLVAALPEGDRPGARLALLAARSPYQVTERDVQAYRAGHDSDAQLVALLSWAAFAAARRVGAWTTRTARTPGRVTG